MPAARRALAPPGRRLVTLDHIAEPVPDRDLGDLAQTAEVPLLRAGSPRPKCCMQGASRRPARRLVNALDRRLPGARGAWTSTTSPTLLAEQRRAERRGRRDRARAADGADLDRHRLAAVASTSTTEPMPTSSPPPRSTISAPSSRARSVRMRASSSPCSFFAAWYSKFSERSPNSRAFLIAATTSARRGPSSSASSSRSASACFAVSGRPLPLRAASPAARRVDEPRPRDLHAGLLELLDVALQPRDRD